MVKAKNKVQLDSPPVVGDIYRGNESGFRWLFRIESVSKDGSFVARSSADVEYLFKPHEHLKWRKITKTPERQFASEMEKTLAWYEAWHNDKS